MNEGRSASRSEDPRVERVRQILNGPASREMAEMRGVYLDDVEALLSAYDEMKLDYDEELNARAVADVFFTIGYRIHGDT